MNLVAKIIAFFRVAFTRKQREREWAARFDTPPADRKNELPLDPRNPGGLT